MDTTETQEENIILSTDEKTNVYNEENNQDKQEISKEEKKKKRLNDECIELKNIKYKSMLLNGVQKETEIKNNLFDIEKVLEKEMQTSQTNIPWTKLEKATKLKKLVDFAETYGDKNKLSEIEIAKLKTVLKESIDRKHLQRIKDVNYDKETCTIIDIPLLTFNENSRKFIVRRNEKKQNTLKSVGAVKRKSAKSKLKTGKNAKTSKIKQPKVGKPKTTKDNKRQHNKTSKSPKTPKSPPSKK
tara:strand:+ start:269 stop:997 length:729 start_codon:yes stop_codon:yes gene_type:complete